MCGFLSRTKIHICSATSKATAEGEIFAFLLHRNLKSSRFVLNHLPKEIFTGIYIPSLLDLLVAVGFFEIIKFWWGFWCLCRTIASEPTARWTIIKPLLPSLLVEFVIFCSCFCFSILFSVLFFLICELLLDLLSCFETKFSRGYKTKAFCCIGNPMPVLK